MLRFEGQALPPNPAIAVISNDAIGNFVAATPLLQMLREKYSPCEIVYFGGKRTLEFQEASDLFESHEPLHGSDSATAVEMLARWAGNFDLVANVEVGPLAKTAAALIAKPEGFVAGPCAGPGGRGELAFLDDEPGRLWRDPEWIAEDLTERYKCLNSGFIGEIFCRGAYLGGPIPPYRVPSAEPPMPIPDVLIGCSASLSEKLWPVESWIKVLQALAERGVSAGLLGAKPSDQRALWLGASAEEVMVRSGLVLDLRGRLTLPQVVGALGKARAVLSLDNGILHLAVAAGTPTVGLYRHGIHRLWAPPFEGLTVMTPGEGREVAEIEPDRVLAALQI
ncbi:MAG: glycosyltransferase family 9 protein [Armatimonadetes bacterium]|nr:glycosyltransferase family 9 protein [Armatimonadota bacterium]